MEKLYAPWRNVYVAGDKKTEHTAQECVFCVQCNENNNEKHFILKRYAHVYVALNLYPYNAGHLLVLPFAHVKELSALSAQVRAELIEVVSLSAEILTTALKAEGINIGLNLGSTAGASLPNHLHMHILPRWTGDTNFLPTLAETKQISVDLMKIYQTLKAEFDRLI